MRAAILAALLLTGCTAIGHTPPPADWPKLTVTEYQVGFWELQKICGGMFAAGVLYQYFGCAWIEFGKMTCDIYYASGDEYGDLARAHERMHCEGYDHIGASTLADGWQEWKKRNPLLANYEKNIEIIREWEKDNVQR